MDSSLSARFDRALTLLRRGEYEQAVLEFTEVIRLYPDDYKAYLGRALAYRGLGEEVKAVADESASKERGYIVPAPVPGESPEQSERQLKKDHRGCFLPVTAVFALSCWAPMFLVHTPSWCLWTEPVLVLLLGDLFMLNLATNKDQRRMSWVAIIGSRLGVLNCDHEQRWTWWVADVACVAVLLLMILAPGWSGWQWLFPVVAAIPCLMLIGFVYLWPIILQTVP